MLLENTPMRHFLRSNIGMEAILQSDEKIRAFLSILDG